MSILLPRPCCLCDLSLYSASRVCGGCQKYFSWRPFDPPSGVEAAAAAALHAGALARAWSRCKYGGQYWRGRWIGEVIASLPIPAGWPEVDCVVGVPSHWSRRWSRGFNQASLLTNPLARALGVEERRGWLSRDKMGAAQAGMDRRQRLEREQSWTWRGPSGLKIALVDDVRTTGSTLAAISRAVEAGEAKVSLCLCLASREASHPPPSAEDLLRLIGEDSRRNTLMCDPHT